MGDPTLVVDNLGYRVRGRWLVRDVSFVLPEGFTAIIGPNGAGKSSLMRTLAGLFPPTRGSLSLGALGTGPAEVTRRIGYIPQFPGAYEHLTPVEFLVRSAWWDTPRHVEILSEQARQILAKLDLSGVESVPGRRLTLSERRRVALACLWMRKAAVVLLDEPTAGLDPQERLAFWRQLFLLRRLPDAPTAYLITTHLLSEVERYCDAVLLLHRGRVYHFGPVSEFIDTARGHSFTATAAGDFIDTGRFSSQGTWVLADRAVAGLIPRPADIVDAYLWSLWQLAQRRSGS